MASAYPPPAAEEALHDLRGIRRELQRQQERAQVVMPLWYEAELMGLVQAWARGVAWNDLLANTSLDKGDVVRIMRRTVDLLAQITASRCVSPWICWQPAGVSSITVRYSCVGACGYAFSG